MTTSQKKSEMEIQEMKKKYNELTTKGLLPLVFKNITIEDPDNNHELRPQIRFNSLKFNNRALKTKYTERAMIL